MGSGFALGLLVIGAGFALLFGGYRLARIMLPLWGFITGMMFGGAIIAELSSTPVLGAALGIVAGIVSGLALAVLSYLFYSAAIIILFGALGYWIGTGFVLLIGSSFGLLAALIGIGLGIVCGIIAVAFNAPKYILIGMTSIAGAIAIAGGLMLLTDIVLLNAFSYGAVQTVIENSAVWAFGVLCLATAGCIIQIIFNADYQLKEWAVQARSSHQSIPPPVAPNEHH
jgi:hypothetical protein